MSRIGNKLVFFNLTSTFILYSISFISAPIFSRLLGANNYGIVQIFISWSSILQIILGLGTVGSLSIAKVKFSSDEFKRYFSSIYFLSVFSFVIGGGSFFFFGTLCTIDTNFDLFIILLIVLNT